MSRRNPVITGSGIICAAGCGVAAVWESVRANRSGLGPLTLFSSPRYANHLVGQVRETWMNSPATCAARVPTNLPGSPRARRWRRPDLDSGMAKSIRPRRRDARCHGRRNVGNGKIPHRAAPRKQTPLRPAALSRMRRRGGFVRQKNRRTRPGVQPFPPRAPPGRWPFLPPPN